MWLGRKHIFHFPTIAKFLHHLWAYINVDKQKELPFRKLIQKTGELREEHAANQLRLACHCIPNQVSHTSGAIWKNQRSNRWHQKFVVRKNGRWNQPFLVCSNSPKKHLKCFQEAGPQAPACYDLTPQKHQWGSELGSTNWVNESTCAGIPCSTQTRTFWACLSKHCKCLVNDSAFDTIIQSAHHLKLQILTAKNSNACWACNSKKEWGNGVAKTEKSTSHLGLLVFYLCLPLPEFEEAMAAWRFLGSAMHKVRSLKKKNANL